MRAAYGEGSLPWPGVEGALCVRLHKLPEEFDGCDMGRLLRALDMLDTYRAASKLQAGHRLTEGEDAILGELLEMDLERQKAGG